MKTEKLDDGSVQLTRESKSDRWPESAVEWVALTGIQDFLHAQIEFDDGEFIGSLCRVYPNRDRVKFYRDVKKFSIADAFDYELHSAWWAPFVGWRVGINLAARYLTWKVQRKWRRYLWSKDRRNRIAAAQQELAKIGAARD